METIMPFILLIHSAIRLAIVVVGVLALIYLFMQWRSNNQSGQDLNMMRAFTTLVDIQVLLGLLIILWGGFSGIGFPRYRLEHAFTMLIVLVVAHLSLRWRNAPPPVRARNSFLTVLACLVLVYLGVAVLPQGWLLG